jgi:hypothetical protein
MQTSRFQLGLIATLAVGLGFSLASSQANGYPGGAAVSLGANPVVSVGGSISRTGSVTVLAAPSTQDIVVNDIGLDFEVTDSTCLGTVVATFTVASTGEVLAKRAMSMNWWSNGYSGQGQRTDIAMNSGLRVPAGDAMTLTISTSMWDSCGASANNLVYTLAGHYAQP